MMMKWTAGASETTFILIQRGLAECATLHIVEECEIIVYLQTDSSNYVVGTAYIVGIGEAKFLYFTHHRSLILYYLKLI